jgi:hypothetical protein
VDSHSVELTFDNMVADHLAAERLYYRSGIVPWVDKAVALLLFVFGVIAVYGAGVQWWTVVWFPLAVLEWFNLLSIRPLQVRWWFSRNPKFSQTYHLRFDDSGIDFHTDSIDSHVAWDHYNRVLCDARVHLLIYGPRMYTLIPARAFESEQQLASFTALVDKHIGERVRA